MLEALIAAVVAVFSAACGWLLSHRWQSKAYRLAVDNERAQWNANVEQWACHVIDVMTQLHYQFEKLEHAKAVDESCELAIKLSILVDQGRLYFPNVMRDQHGTERQVARQGYRSAVLDPLVAAVKIAKGEKPNFDTMSLKEKYGSNQYSKALRVYQNAFLSLIESVLLVKKTHESLIERLVEVDDIANAAKLRSFLLPENGNGPIPPGEKYWLGKEGGVPSERVIFERE